MRMHGSTGWLPQYRVDTVASGGRWHTCKRFDDLEAARRYVALLIADEYRDEDCIRIIDRKAGVSLPLVASAAPANAERAS